MDNLNTDAVQDEAIFAYRLGRLEKTFEASFKEIGDKIDKFNVMRDTQIIHGEQIKSLMKSRDRLIGAVIGLGSSVALLLIVRVMEWSK